MKHFITLGDVDAKDMVIDASDMVMLMFLFLDVGFMPQHKLLFLLFP